MKPEEFLKHLQEHAASFAKAVATNEGEWIIKGFIDVYQNVGLLRIDGRRIGSTMNQQAHDTNIRQDPP